MMLEEKIHVMKRGVWSTTFALQIDKGASIDKARAQAGDAVRDFTTAFNRSNYQDMQLMGINT